MTEKRSDCLILGGGLVGLTTAIGLARHGIDCAVVDTADLSTTVAPAFDGRATAIASATWRMLDALGVADTLRPDACPIARIEVRDGDQREALDFTPGDGEPLGWMVENRRLRAALIETARALSAIDLRAPARVATLDRDAGGVRATLIDGTRLRADVVLVCEGRRSPTRDAAGFRMARWQYDHHAVIAAITHDRPHDNVAHEIFYPGGPFALLPMLPGNRSAIVWSVPATQGPGVVKLGDAAFRHELQRLSGGVVGTIGDVGPRQSWPLGFHHAATMTAPRLALVGDAAHGIHPIAGQGLNLGLRDAAAIVEVLVDASRLGLDLGDATVLTRYQRWRGFDVAATAGATDVLTRLFGLPGPLPRAGRRLGLAAVQRLRPAKDFFMAEARGENGTLPAFLQSATI